MMVPKLGKEVVNIRNSGKKQCGHKPAGISWRTSVCSTDKRYQGPTVYMHCAGSLGYFHKQTDMDLCPHGTYILMRKVFHGWGLTKARWSSNSRRFGCGVYSKMDSGMGNKAEGQWSKLASVRCWWELRNTADYQSGCKARAKLMARMT